MTKKSLLRTEAAIACCIATKLRDLLENEQDFNAHFGSLCKADECHVKDMLFGMILDYETDAKASLRELKATR